MQPQPLQIAQLLVVLDRHRKHARATLEAEHALKYQAQLQQQKHSAAKQPQPSPSSSSLPESMPAAELEPLVRAGELRLAVNEALVEFKRIKPLAERVQVSVHCCFAQDVLAHAK